MTGYRVRCGNKTVYVAEDGVTHVSRRRAPVLLKEDAERAVRLHDEDVGKCGHTGPLAELEEAGPCDHVYTERDQLVAALSKLFPSFLARHPEQEDWDHSWRWIVFVLLPTGQVSWHVHDSELPWFDHLERRDGDKWWDGHPTQEKYERLAKLPVR